MFLTSNRRWSTHFALNHWKCAKSFASSVDHSIKNKRMSTLKNSQFVAMKGYIDLAIRYFRLIECPWTIVIGKASQHDPAPLPNQKVSTKSSSESQKGTSLLNSPYKQQKSLDVWWHFIVWNGQDQKNPYFWYMLL